MRDAQCGVHRFGVDDIQMSLGPESDKVRWHNLPAPSEAGLKRTVDGRNSSREGIRSL
jgi:hypothetical protein